MDIYRNQYNEDLHANRKIKEEDDGKKSNNRQLLHNSMRSLSSTTKGYSNKRNQPRDKNNGRDHDINDKNRSMTIPHMIYKGLIWVKNKKKTFFDNSNLAKDHTNGHYGKNS